MTIERCIIELEESGKLTPEQAEEVRDLFTTRRDRNRQQMGPDAAAARASEETVQAMERAAQMARVQKLLQMKAQQRIIADLASYRGTSRANAAMALFDHDQRAPYLNVEALRKVIVGQAHAQLTDVLVRHRRNLIGAVRHREDLDDVVRELFGVKTGSANAAEMADAFRKVSEGLRQRFNAAGGNIGKLEDWGLPQRHSAVQITRAGFDGWRDFIMPRLDRSRMVDDVTGLPLTDRELSSVLEHVFDTVRTGGWNARIPGGGVGVGRKLASRRADSRVLHFADADSWLEYQQRFGDGGEGAAFDAMIGHVEGMARDIAHMEVLGPNPAATVRWLQDMIRREAALGRGPGTEGQTGEWGALRVQHLYDTTSGRLNAPVSAKWANIFGSVRSLNVAQMLGSAFLSSITDTGFQAITRGFNGLPVTGALTGYMKLFRPGFTEDMKVAVRLGLIAEEAAKLGATQQRFLGESVSHEWSRRLADFTLRATGLSPWTQAGRWAFGMEFLGTLADHAGSRFDELQPPLLNALDRYGITADEWDVARSVDPYQHRGAAFLRPEDVANSGARDGRTIANKIMAMVLTETEFAVPATSVRGRSLTTVDRPGTFWGEAARNVVLFKGFGISVILNHGGRMAALGPVNGALYAAGLTITLTMLGAMVIQMREIGKGRDPFPMADAPEINQDNEPRGGFWARAILQGGGFGIFGDFIAAGTSERQGSIASSLIGPSFGMLEDASKVATGQSGASDVLRRYTPFLSSAWYARAAYERLVVDQLKAQTDPDHYKSWRRMETRLRNEGRGYFWRPGQVAPGRGPSLDQAIEPPPASAAR